MEAIFLRLVNMSISASWMILAVVLLRLLLRKAPRYIHCLLWALVGVRLAVPFSLRSVLSLIPSAQTVPENIALSPAPAVDTGIEAVDQAVNPAISSSFAPDVTASANPLQVWLAVLAAVWTAGVAAMAIYGMVSAVRLRRRVAPSINLRDELWLCDDIASPFILGIIRPRIYIPSGLEASALDSVEAHEKAHLARKDHWWRPIGFAILAVHWFNPLVWLAYALFCRDTEMACDQRVIKEMDMPGRKEYSSALLSCAVSHPAVLCPLAFGEVGVKKRVRSVLSHKNPTVWIITAAVLVCIVFAVCFLTDPVSVDAELEAYLSGVILDHGRASHTGDNFACEEHKLLGVDEGEETTVYLLVMYNEYSCEDGVIVNETGSHIPTAITVRKTGGGYELVEYWESGDGTRYVPSIREKFPWYLEERAIKIHLYAPEHEAGCIAQAEEHFGVKYIDPYENTTWTTTAVIAQPVELRDVASMNIGAQMPSIIYGDGTRFIIHGAGLLLIYDAQRGEVVYRLPAGWTEMNGIDILTAAASEDGRTVYLGDVTAEGSVFTHALDTGSFRVREYSDTLSGGLFAMEDMSAGYYDLLGTAVTGRFLVGDSVADTGDALWYLRAYTDWQMVNLQLVRRDKDTGAEQVRYIFHSVKQPLPSLAAMGGEKDPMTILSGRTLPELAAVWGDPENPWWNIPGEAESYEDLRWPLPESELVLTVTFDTETRVVKDARLSAGE